MVEDGAGRRTLYAPTRQLAEFLRAAYRFHDVQVPPPVVIIDRCACAGAAAASPC
jgi:hypothetical protein